MLVDFVTRRVRDTHATEIQLTVSTFNEQAIAFYEDLGFGTLRRAMTRSFDHRPTCDDG